MLSPLLRSHGDGPRLTQVSVDQDTPPAAVRRSHRDGAVTRVGPVEVVLDPVESQTLWGEQLRVDQSHVMCQVTRLVDVGTEDKVS